MSRSTASGAPASRASSNSVTSPRSEGDSIEGSRVVLRESTTIPGRLTDYFSVSMEAGFMGNNIKTFVLLAGLLAAFIAVGDLLGGTQGMLLALVIGGLLNFIM